MPEISVIVVNFNGLNHLETCLKALQNQSYKDFEIILIDNGSTDGSLEFVQERFPAIRLISLPENVGFARANNLGIQASAGKYIALLNNDTKADRHWLNELRTGLKQNERVGACASKLVRFFEPAIIDSAGDDYTVAGATMARGRGENRYRQYCTEEKVFGPCAGAALYRRTALDQVGCFDADFFCYYEDADLSFRLMLQGYDCLYIPTAVVYHKGAGTSSADPGQKIFLAQRNLELCFFKNMPWPLLVRYLPAHLCLNLLGFFFFAAQGNGTTYIRAKIAAVSQLPQILKKWADLQGKRRIEIGALSQRLKHEWLIRQLFYRIPKRLSLIR